MYCGKTGSLLLVLTPTGSCARWSAWRSKYVMSRLITGGCPYLCYATLYRAALSAPTPAEKLRVVEVVLLERAAGMLDGQPVVEYAVEKFLARPATSKVAEVANKTGFSSRRFIELFKQHVGMAPKVFCRVKNPMDTNSQAFL